MEKLEALPTQSVGASNPVDASTTVPRFDPLNDGYVSDETVEIGIRFEEATIHTPHHWA